MQHSICNDDPMRVANQMAISMLEPPATKSIDEAYFSLDRQNAEAKLLRQAERGLVNGKLSQEA